MKEHHAFLHQASGLGMSHKDVLKCILTDIDRLSQKKLSIWNFLLSVKTKNYFVQGCLREEKVKRKIGDEKQCYLPHGWVAQ